MRRVIKASAAV